MKSEVSGPFADDWKKAFGDISKEVEEIDIAPALSLAAFSVKDETELVSHPWNSPAYATANRNSALDAHSFPSLQWNYGRLLGR